MYYQEVGMGVIAVRGGERWGRDRRGPLAEPRRPPVFGRCDGVARRTHGDDSITGAQALGAEFAPLAKATVS